MEESDKDKSAEDLPSKEYLKKRGDDYGLDEHGKKRFFKLDEKWYSVVEDEGYTGTDIVKRIK